jgi:hypothetical protein
VQQLAQGLNSVIEREIGQRAVAAVTLAASTAVRDGNVPRVPCPGARCHAGSVQLGLSR